MPENLVAVSKITINASPQKVWGALTNPEVIKRYFFGSEVVTDWKENSPIVWKGIWKDTPYEDKGTILQIIPEKLLQVTHYSPLSGAPDVPENYHIVTYELAENGELTELSLTQDNNATEDERQHSQQMWNSMLAGLKKTVENE